ncbi:MAG: 30S ribosomal protein S20 [Desulfobacteraceae bacterium]
MANHKSAIKRARQNEIRRIRNRSVKTRVKSVVKNVRQAVAAGSGEALDVQLKEAQSAIDKATKKGVMHKRTAARKVARLAKLTQSVSS